MPQVSPEIKCVDEVSPTIAALLADLAKCPQEVFPRTFDIEEHAADLIKVERDAARGADLRLRFVPSPRLLDLAAAVRAGCFDDFMVKWGAHPVSP